MKVKIPLPFLVLLLMLSFGPFDVHACNDWTARDEAYWNKMYGEARPFLFPLEPVSLSSPGGLSALNEDGIKALGRGDYGEAERIFSEAIRTSPDSAPLHHNLALLFYRKLDLERAAGLWKKAVLLDPGNLRYLYHLAFAFSSGGRAEEAIPLYQDLLTKIHRQPEIYNDLGQLFEFRGDVLQAERNFRKALTLRPDYLPALNNLGRLYRKADRMKEAEHVFKKVARLRPKDVESYLNLGALYADTGDTFRAAKYLRKAIRLRPDYPELHLLLSAVYREMGRTRGAHEEELLAHAITCKLRPNME
jgi:tetratricopeptide (TPR) repeat protein